MYESPNPLPDGARFPNIVTFATRDNTYYNTLPSFELACNTSDNAVVRAAASRTMTRPDPNAQLPGLNFSGPSTPAVALGDCSSSVDLAELFGWQNKIEVTLDAINLFDQEQRTYFQFENAAYTNYKPGRQFLVGLRGRF